MLAAPLRECLRRCVFPRDRADAKQTPHLPFGPARALLAMRRDPLAFLCRARRDHGDIVAIGWGRPRFFLLSHPDHVRHVLVDGVRLYDKQTRGYRTLALFLGQGLLTAEGELWRRQRRIAQPAFHRDRIAHFGTLMVDFTTAMLDRWQPHNVVDVQHEMTRLTLRIAAKTLLGTDVDVHAVFGPSLARLNAEARRRINSPWALPPAIPTPRTIRVRRSAQAMDRVIFDVIERRRRDGSKHDDLLGMLMDAVDEDTGAAMPDGQLRDEAMTIFVAGHETTAAALSWTLALLSLHPDVDRRLAAELAVLDGRVPTLGDLPRLPFTLQVIKESLRLYPPAWVMTRRATQDDVVDGRPIPAGSLVFLSPYVTHRHPGFWDDPEAFDPDRFSPEAERTRPRLAYFPFGGGQRLCIGQAFALMEAHLVLATLRQRFAPTLEPGQRLEPEPFITLRPRAALRMRLRPATPPG